MAEIRTGTPEEVAYCLMRDIANVEKRDLSSGRAVEGTTKAEREWILTTYGQCLEITKHHGSPIKQV